MLLQDAAIHHHFETCGSRPFCCRLILDSLLHPDHFRAYGDGRIDNRTYLIGAPELISHATEPARHVGDWDRADLLKGIASHPRGDKWVQWQPQ